mmetsp:Transcript_13055/g.41253  ORF Transcript_13055/g.41253 Transcript_13055/m.41253 type:complete len:120 (+) Transcript_13055:362-721(+)
MVSTSVTSCVTTILVSPKAAFSSLISLTNTPIEIGSCPAKGSSYMIKSGSSAIALARAARLAIPPDSSLGIKFAAPRRPTASSFNKTIVSMISSDKLVCSLIGNATLSNTEILVNNAPL